ncbi:MAG: RimK family protein [Cyclobacteriaceae bacterium]
MIKLIVVEQPNQWEFAVPDTKVITPEEYIGSEVYAKIKRVRVINLCQSYAYQSTGYYISLLAQARDHKVIPATSTMMDLKIPNMMREDIQDFNSIIQEVLDKYTHEEKCEFDIYFGMTNNVVLNKIGSLIFNLFQIPVQHAVFKKKEKWELSSLKPLSTKDLSKKQKVDLSGAISLLLTGKNVVRKSFERKKYDLAILVAPNDVTAPSDAKALQKFVKAADKIGFNTEFITRSDYGKLTHFDALFIRETTNVNHHTFRFARKAEYEGIVVIDDTNSILKCTNKVYLNELLQANKIPTPKSIIVQKKNALETLKDMPFPFVLKQPDGAFSKGVKKVKNQDELVENLNAFFLQTEMLLAQEFMPTDFDWRVGVLDGQPIYVCKYFMARNHWQIVDWKSDKVTRLGNHETIAIKDAPKNLLNIALKSTGLIGQGLYGVDIKEINGQFYVIEVNDNPSIDSGIEDQVEKNALYENIMKYLMRKVINSDGK